jgi:hypothetical protein
MSKFTGTMVTGDAKGLREDLTDMIYNISPTKTPMVSAIGRGKAQGVLHEWQTDSLTDAITTNAQPEGDDHTFATPDATVRLGNYCQISHKTALVSGTLDAVRKAGRKSEMGYQMAKKSAELKRDIAMTITANQAASGSDPRKSAGLLAWLYTNVDYATASGGNPSYTTLPNDDRTDATTGDLRTFQEAQLSGVLSDCWDAGAEPSEVYMGSFAKASFSGFAGEYSKTYDVSKVKAGAIIASADVYVGDFGTVKVIPNRFQRGRDVFVIDPEYLSIAYLRPFHSESLAKTSDGNKRVIRAEWTLKVHNEKAHGAILDLKAEA